jgi:hypothetical protein
MRARVHLAVGLAILIVLVPAAVTATPADGHPAITFGSGNDVGASIASVNAIALGDLDNDGDLDIISGTGSDEDNEIIVWQNDGTPFSDLWIPNDVGTTGTYGASSIAVGDLDNDGDLDIVSGSSSGDVDVWENSGAPFSGAWSTVEAGSYLWEATVALGDLDNDGYLDIALGTSTTEYYNVIVLENDGTPFNGSWPDNDAGDTLATVWGIDLGDLDNDGDLDIVTACDEQENYQVIAWRNDGTPFSDYWSPKDVGNIGEGMNAVALADLDSDGDLDILTGGEWNSDSVLAAWENDGDPFEGTWTLNSVKESGDGARTLAVGDLDNDGDVDIAAGYDSTAGTEVEAYQNDGMPFSDQWQWSDAGHSDSDVNSVAVGDLDNDGDLDIVSGSHSEEDYEIIAFPNTLPPDSIPLGFPGTDVGASADHVYGVAIGDLDNDGDLDVLSGSTLGEDYELIAWENDRSPFDGTWAPNDVGAAEDSIYGVALGDLDNDGDLDAVSVGNYNATYEIIVWENDSSPFTDTWTPNNAGTSYRSVWEAVLGDLDNDGDLDLAVVRDDGSNDEVIVLQNDGSPFSGTWAENGVGDSDADMTSVALGDLDNDGYLDMVTASESLTGPEIKAWMNDDTPFTGSWSSNNFGDTGTAGVKSVALGDLDNDGYLDVVSGGAIQDDYEVIAWRNDGSPFTGSWTQNDAGATESHLSTVALGDFDNDGDLDVVSAELGGSESELVVWENDGLPFSGLWTERRIGVHEAHLYYLALGDIDLDGDLDVVSGSAREAAFEIVAWQNRDDLQVYLPLVLRSY